MARRLTRTGIVRWLSGLLASVLVVAAVSGPLVLFQRWLPPLQVLYILAVMPVAVVWGSGLVALTAVLSAAAYAYLFIPPTHTLKIPGSQTSIAPGGFPGHGGGHGGLAAPAGGGRRWGRAAGLGRAVFRDAGASTGTGSPITVDRRLWGCRGGRGAARRRGPGRNPTRLAGFTELAATAIANPRRRPS